MPSVMYAGRRLGYAPSYSVPSRQSTGPGPPTMALADGGAYNPVPPGRQGRARHGLPRRDWMRILVTGGTGFTGHRAGTAAARRGHDVVALDYKEGLQCDALRALGAEVVIGSVTDRDSRGAEHAGRRVRVPPRRRLPRAECPDTFYDEVNVRAPATCWRPRIRPGRLEVRVLQHLRRARQRGPSAGQRGRPDPAGRLLPADQVRGRAVRAGRSAPRTMETVILRPAAIYGPGDPERFFMIFKRVAKGTSRCSAAGGPSTIRCTSTISSTPSCSAWPTGAGNGRVYLIADEHYYPIEDDRERRWAGRSMFTCASRTTRSCRSSSPGHICEKLCKPFGIVPPIFPRRVDWFRQNRAFDITRAKRELGYAPRIALDEGLRRTGEWYREMGYLPTPPGRVEPSTVAHAGSRALTQRPAGSGHVRRRASPVQVHPAPHFDQQHRPEPVGALLAVRPCRRVRRQKRLDVSPARRVRAPGRPRAASNSSAIRVQHFAHLGVVLEPVEALAERQHPLRQEPLAGAPQDVLLGAAVDLELVGNREGGREERRDSCDARSSGRRRRV